jgi:hypothetical protein
MQVMSRDRLELTLDIAPHNNCPAWTFGGDAIGRHESVFLSWIRFPSPWETTPSSARNGTRHGDDKPDVDEGKGMPSQGQPVARLQQRIGSTIDGWIAARLKVCFLLGTGTWLTPTRTTTASVLPARSNPFRASHRTRLDPDVFASCSQLAMLEGHQWGLTTPRVWFICLDGEPGPIDGGSRPSKRPLNLLALR